MPILCLGLNHNTAPLALRERLAFDPARTRATVSRYGFGRTVEGPIHELVVLSTCNRVEIYAFGLRAEFAPLMALLAEAGGVEPQAIGPHAYRLVDGDAVRHLLRVASGLDSMVLGEPQILGQVAEAHTLALRGGSSGLVLARLFQAAIHAGKRVRHETGISAGSANVSAVAVHMVASLVPDLRQAAVLVVGSGEMAELAVEAMRKRGATQLAVVNRSVARAAELAGRWGASAHPFEALEQQLARADVVISSTGAPHVVVHREMVEAAMARRPQRPLVILDIAVPRDVDEDVARLPGVRVYDLDHLNAHLSHSVEERRACLPLAESILDQEHRAFDAWLRTLAVRPLIRDLRRQAEAIRRKEVERTLRRMDGRSGATPEELEALTRSLVDKLLDAPTRVLKKRSEEGDAGRAALAARELFQLPHAAPDEGR